MPRSIPRTNRQNELGLRGISPNPRCLIVAGRSSALTEENKRKLAAMEGAWPRLKIMTFDDLVATAKATFENLLGLMFDAGPHAEVYPVAETSTVSCGWRNFALQPQLYGCPLEALLRATARMPLPAPPHPS